MNDKTPKPGDYVLATKYNDGDPGDQFCVGFYKEAYKQCGFEPRHIVVDAEGNPFRANGFRRVKKISAERGAWIVKNLKEISQSRFSVWHFARCSMKELRTLKLTGGSSPKRSRSEALISKVCHTSRDIKFAAP